MVEPPVQRDLGDESGVGAGREPALERSPDESPTNSSSRSSMLVVAGIAALVAVIVILHLTGVIGPQFH